MPSNQRSLWRRPSSNQRDLLWWARFSAKKPDESPWPAGVFDDLKSELDELRAAAEEERLARRRRATELSQQWPAEVDS